MIFNHRIIHDVFFITVEYIFMTLIFVSSMCSFYGRPIYILRVMPIFISTDFLL